MESISGVTASMRGSKRRRPPLTKVAMGAGILNLSGVTTEDTDTDISFQKTKYPYSDYNTNRTMDSRRTLDLHRPATPSGSVDYDYSMANKLDASSYYDSELVDTNTFQPHRLENEIPRIAAKPMVDSSLENSKDFYDDQSLIREHTPQRVPARPLLPFANAAYDDQSLDRSYAGSPRRIPARPAFDYDTGSTSRYPYDDMSMERPSPHSDTSSARRPKRPELDFIPVRPSPVDFQDSSSDYPQGTNAAYMASPVSPQGHRDSPAGMYRPSPHRPSPHRPSPYQPTPSPRPGAFQPSPAPLSYQHDNPAASYSPESPSYDTYDTIGDFDRQYQGSPRRVGVPPRPALDRNSRSSSNEYLSDGQHKPRPKETAM